MRDELLSGQHSIFQAEELFIIHGLVQDRQPGLLALQHRADEYILESIFLEMLSFGTLTDQRNDLGNTDLCGLFDEPFKAAGIL